MRNLRLLCFVVAVFLTQRPLMAQTAYYWNGTGAIHLNTSWGTNLDGSGFRPGSFSAAGDAFHFQSGQVATGTSQWSVTSGARVIIQSGAELISGAFNHNLNSVTLESGAIFTSTNATYGGTIFDSIDPNSTVQLLGNGSGNTNLRPSFTYGNLVFGNPAAFSLSTTAQITALGTVTHSGTGALGLAANTSPTHHVGSFVVAAGSTLRLTNGNGSSSLNVTRDFINNGIITKPGAGSGTINFVGADTGTLTLGDLGTSTVAFHTTISEGRAVNLTDTFITSVNRSVENNGLFNVNSTAVFGGTGAVIGSGSINVAGSLVAGSTGSGTLEISQDVNFTSTGKLMLSVGANAGSIVMSGSDHVLSFDTIAYIDLVSDNFDRTLEGDFTLVKLNGSNSNLLVIDGLIIENGEPLAVFSSTGDNEGSTTGLAKLNLTGFNLVAGDQFILRRDASGDLSLMFVPVPEPGAMLVVATSILGLAGYLRRKKVS